MKHALIANLFIPFAVASAAEVSNEGKIVEVNPPKREIYVLSDGQRLEYYFNPATTVFNAGQPARYEDLQEGMRVRVTAEKIGRRLDPANVEILP